MDSRESSVLRYVGGTVVPDSRGKVTQALGTQPKIRDFMKPHESFHMILMAARIKYNVQ